MRHTVSFAAAALIAATATAGQSPSSQWVQLWNTADDAPETGMLVVVAPDGSVYVAGKTGNATEDQDITLLKYDAAGRLEWVRHFDGPAGGADSPTDIEITPEGVSL
ncbi:MAG: hypothetical protein L0271_20110, partial [Gemmatimonadetes bacterium]|nr:hypothetical protein [Gemmatimonadota bacterium]